MDRVGTVGALAHHAALDSSPTLPSSAELAETSASVWTVFTSPSRAFVGLRNRPRWFGPLVIAAAASAISQTWLIQRIGTQQVIATALRNSGALDTAGAIRNLTSNTPAVLTGQALASALGCFFAAAVIACALWLSAALAGEQVRFKKLISVTSLVVFAYSVTRACMIVATAALASHPERINIKDPLATSVVYFVNAPSSIWTPLFGSLDVLSIGAVLLLVQGLTIVGGVSAKRSVFAVTIPWVAYLARGFVGALL